jgi:hypothetical protein
MPVDPPGHTLGRGGRTPRMTLPPKERACVLEYSLEEIAELVESTVGGGQSRTETWPHKIGGYARTSGAATAEERRTRAVVALLC